MTAPTNEERDAVATGSPASDSSRHRRTAPTHSSTLHDSTGAPVTIRLDESRPIGAYTVHLDDGTLAGRAEFIDAHEAGGERIFFHTEVDEQFSGRGLGRLLVREALADSSRKNLAVVPVCPLFASHLGRHGAEFLADGGRSRQPTRADVDLVEHARSGA